MGMMCRPGLGRKFCSESVLRISREGHRRIEIVPRGMNSSTFKMARCFLLSNLVFTVMMVVFLFCHDCASQTLNNTEVQALMAFRREISDPFSALKDWSPSNSESRCNWTGITCSADGRVVEINLQNKSLVGFVAPAIANLSFLQVLNLSTNSLAGDIPNSLGRSPRLKFLCLQQNNISGLIPPEIGNISTLLGLYLSENNLAGDIPSSLGGLRKLRDLHLFRNANLSGPIPLQLGSLVGLQEFLSYGNSLAGMIPESLCNCTGLRKLRLSENSLTGPLPHCIGFLRHLIDLDTSYNMLSGPIVPGILNCSALQSLQLDLNNFSGPIPSIIGNKLPSLKVLSLQRNFLTGIIPDSLANVTGMERLMLSHNGLKGHIPLYFRGLSDLQSLDLSFNSFDEQSIGANGEISVLKALSNCSRLVRLALQGNRLKGTLPPDLGKLQHSLQSLLLDQNSITGNIPDAIGNLSSLVSLRLSGNQLHGRIPPSLAGMTSLQLLDLSGNNYHGSIPREFTLMNGSLTYILLGNNNLSGSIPSFLATLQNLRSLSLSRNNFTGNIPSAIGNCILLENLDLSSNFLVGDIPEEVAGLSHIVECFNLSRNMLRGIVPGGVGKMIMADCIDLSDNKLSGNIAQYMTEWLSVTELNLSFNSFSGQLPDSLGQKLVVLEVIDLSANKFTGLVPPSLANLSNLQFLNFSGNNFEGPVPCSGAFEQLRKNSFLHNPTLCGTCMGFPVCPEKRSNESQHHNSKHRKIIIMCVIISSVAGFSFILLTVYALLSWSKSRKALVFENAEVESVVRESFLMVSEEQLRRATENYSDKNLLGRGGYSCVYRGVLQEDLEVAVKIFHDDLGAFAERRFSIECRALHVARHKNVVKILSAYSKGNFKALVLEFMPNGTLDSLLHDPQADGRRASLSMKSQVNILRGLASALCYLHNYCKPPVLHCDVKPQNVLLDSRWNPRLSGFGLARLLGPSLFPSSFPVSVPWTVTGTVGYVAPEYGMGGDVSSKGDVYSFGVVVLEVLTRRRPTDSMFGDRLTLRNWVSEAVQGNEGETRQKLLGIVTSDDEDVDPVMLQGEFELKAIKVLAKLGVWCTSNDANRRPTMIQVQGFLEHLLFGDPMQQLLLPLVL